MAGFYSRLASDPALREAVKSDARAALTAEGLDVPDSVNIEVVESTADTLYIALPPMASDELSDEALAGVDGAGISFGGAGRGYEGGGTISW